jgi:hypothetical protein
LLVTVFVPVTISNPTIAGCTCRSMCQFRRSKATGG